MPCALEMRVVSSRNFDWEISCNHIGKFLDMAQGTQEEQAHILIIVLCFYHFEPKGAKNRWLFLRSQNLIY